jgi:hypothetical protein
MPISVLLIVVIIAVIGLKDVAASFIVIIITPLAHALQLGSLLQEK